MRRVVENKPCPSFCLLTEEAPLAYLLASCYPCGGRPAFQQWNCDLETGRGAEEESLVAGLVASARLSGQLTGKGGQAVEQPETGIDYVKNGTKQR